MNLKNVNWRKLIISDVTTYMWMCITFYSDETGCTITSENNLPDCTVHRKNYNIYVEACNERHNEHNSDSYDSTSTPFL